MTALEQLLRLVDAIGDDHLHRSHPTAWPKESRADRQHDQTRPADPTAEAACDPARQALAQYRAEAWRVINNARRRDDPKAPLAYLDAAWARRVVADLDAAWGRWHGSVL